MNVAGVQLLAGSGFTEQEHGRIGCGHLLDLFEDTSGRVAASHDLALDTARFARRRPLPAGWDFGVATAGPPHCFHLTYPFAANR
jgi:hypothetical protein